MKNIQTLVIVGGIILSIYALFTYFNKVDSRLLESSKVYEACVLNTYGVTPSAYLEANGEYPVCM